jgi:heat shock protein 4
LAARLEVTAKRRALRDREKIKQVVRRKRKTRDKGRKKRKKKTKKTPLKVDAVTWGLNKADMENKIQKLLDLEMADKLIADTLDRKNAVESYVYETRDAVDMKLRTYISDEHRATLMAALDDAENWLYDDSESGGENGTKSDYINKLAELKVMGDPVELRFKEAEFRPIAVSKLQSAIEAARAFVGSEDEKYAHIEAEDRAKVSEAADKAAAWLNENLAAQEALPPTEPPAFMASAVDAQVTPVTKITREISSKPKPKPKEEPKPEEAPKEGEEAKAEGDAPKAEGEEAPAAEETKEGAEPAADKPNADMDIDVD